MPRTTYTIRNNGIEFQTTDAGTAEEYARTDATVTAVTHA